MGERPKPSYKTSSKTGGIPRRTFYALNVPVEDAIRGALDKAHELREVYPNDERLSEAVVCIAKAQGLMHDFIDDFIEKQL